MNRPLFLTLALVEVLSLRITAVSFDAAPFALPLPEGKGM